MTKKLWLPILLLVVSQSALAVPMLTNGDFETGDFSGWTVGSTQSSPFTGQIFSPGYTAIARNDANTANAWAIRNTSANYFPGNPATPISGHSAFNGFDGSPGVLYLEQDFLFSGGTSTAAFSFDWALQSNCCVNRDLRNFSVNLLDSTDSLISTIFDYTRPAGYLDDWNIEHEAFDLSGLFSSLSADTYTLEFKINIPENYSGPAQFAIDNISLDIETASVPEPESLALLALGLAGLAFSRKRKIA